jgi:hypothetical protein
MGVFRFRAAYPEIKAMKWTGRNKVSVDKFAGLDAEFFVNDENSLVFSERVIAKIGEYVVKDGATGIIFTATEKELITFYSPMTGSKATHGN